MRGQPARSCHIPALPSVSPWNSLPSSSTTNPRSPRSRWVSSPDSRVRSRPAGVPGQVWVKGEVQNLKRHSNGHTYFALVEKAAGRPRAGPSRLRALPRRPASGRPRLALQGARRRARQRRRSAHPRPGRDLRRPRPAPAGDDGHRSGVHRRWHRRQPRAGAPRGRRPRACSSRTRGGDVFPGGAVRIGLITSAGSAAYHDFVHELELSPLRLARRARRRAGAGRGRGTPDRLGTARALCSSTSTPS